jgi:protein gp37
MANTSAIEWTDATWNPVTGCTQVSPGCDNCYALRFAERWRNVSGNYFEGGFDVKLRPNMLNRPTSWKKPRLIFVNSMSDLFHSVVPNDFIDLVFEQMEMAPWHTYQVLTKRPERLRRYVSGRYGSIGVPKQIWLGTSVENNDYAWRVDMLRQCNATTRFLSIEPMLGPVDAVSFSGIAWIIVGGESGPHKRLMNGEWVRDVRDRCVAAHIPFFFKQWHKGKTGRELDGRTWDQMPS